MVCKWIENRGNEGTTNIRREALVNDSSRLKENWCVCVTADSVIYIRPTFDSHLMERYKVTVLCSVRSLRNEMYCQYCCHRPVTSVHVSRYKRSKRDCRLPELM